MTDTHQKSLEEDQDQQENNDPLKTFPKSEGITTEIAQELLQQYGMNEIPQKTVPKWRSIWEKITNTSSSVETLKKSLRPTSICFRDGKWERFFDIGLLVPGDLIQVACGMLVPADCMINSGLIVVDMSAMTGASLPITIHEREMARMGTTVVRGETSSTVVLTGKNTLLAHCLNLGTQLSLEDIERDVQKTLFALKQRMEGWNKTTHKYFSKGIRDQIETLLLLSRFNKETKRPIHKKSLFCQIPTDVLFEIFKFITAPPHSIPTVKKKNKGWTINGLINRHGTPVQ